MLRAFKSIGKNVCLQSTGADCDTGNGGAGLGTGLQTSSSPNKTHCQDPGVQFIVYWLSFSADSYYTAGEKGWGNNMRFWKTYYETYPKHMYFYSNARLKPTGHLVKDTRGTPPFKWLEIEGIALQKCVQIMKHTKKSTWHQWETGTLDVYPISWFYVLCHCMHLSYRVIDYA